MKVLFQEKNPNNYTFTAIRLFEVKGQQLTKEMAGEIMAEQFGCTPEEALAGLNVNIYHNGAWMILYNEHNTYYFTEMDAIIDGYLKEAGILS